MRFLNGLLTVVLLLMVAVGGIAYYFDSQFDAPGPLDRTKVVVIPKGESTQEIAARLEREGVIGDRRLFVAGYLWAKFAAWLGGDKTVQLKAGDFEMRQSVSIQGVVDILSEGHTITYKVTIPEGLTSQQIVDRLLADPNLTGDIAAVPAEGSLLPETFIVQRGSPRQAVLDNMTAQSQKLMERVWAQRKKDLPIKSWEEALVLASIVEKETGRNDERARVAAVFYNRLRQNMRLQSDPTILYGLQGGKVAWGRPILKSEILQKTSHNTYQIDGLPPTPICNAGRAAIEAVLNPADTKDLFFVADGAGGHTFSETLKDHNSNVVKWRAQEKEMKAKTAPANTTTNTTPTTHTTPTPTTTTINPAAGTAGASSSTGEGARAVPKKDTKAAPAAKSTQTEVLPWAAKK
jgi:peptidoglycan lytic transglycosylase G